MRILDEVALYVKVCDEINLFSLTEIKKLLGLSRFKNKESRLTIPEYLTLIIKYKYSSMKYLKNFWFNEKYFSNNAWPNMPSYPRFIIWINRLQDLLKALLNKSLVNLNQELGFVDSTKLTTTSNYWYGKIHKTANKGYSSTGDFRGYKLHSLINTKSQLVSYEITSASVHDLTPVKGSLFNNQVGKILGDSGYISREIYHDLMHKNIEFITKPKQKTRDNELLVGFSNTTSYLSKPWEKFVNLYKKRVTIERYFSNLKENFNLKLNKLHSTKSLFTHIYSALLACQWQASNIIQLKII